jgi:uncharacterized protein (DUF2062 family)
MRAWIQAFRARVHLLLRQHLSPESIGLAVGVGVFIGCLPLYGLHLVICVTFARLLRLNQALVYTAANISNPFIAPFLISGQIALGEWLLHGDATATATRTLEQGTVWAMAEAAPDLLWSCAVGSVLMGGALGAFLGGAALLVARRWTRGIA